MGFKAAAASAARSKGVPLAQGRAMVAAGAQNASPKAKKANPNLLKVSGVKKTTKKTAAKKASGTKGY